MREKSNLVSLMVILTCAVVIGLLVGWLAIRDPRGDSKPGDTTNVDTTPTTSNTVVTTPETPPVETNAQPGESTEPVTPAKNWDDQLSDILGDENIDEDAKADKLADMIPGLPEPAQLEIAGHLVNLVSDEDFTNKASKILVAETTPKSVSETLFDDLMNRNDALRLPLTLEIAKNPKHPLKAEALESLEMSLVEEFGEDWTKWDAAIQESLKEQGLLDEPTEETDKK